MSAREMLYNGQAQSGSSHYSRTSAVDTIKSFKKAPEVLSWNAFARVLDEDLVRCASFFFARISSLARSSRFTVEHAAFKFVVALFKSNCHLAILAIELDGVIHQVRQHLFQAPRVCVNQGFAIDGVRHDYASRRSLGSQQRDYIVDDCAQLDLLCFYLHVAGLDGA